MNSKIKLLTRLLLATLFFIFSGCEKDLYENTIQQNNSKLKVTEKYFDELRLNANFNKAFAKLSKSEASKNSSTNEKKSVEENYAFTFSNLPVKVIEAVNKTTYTFLIYSTNNSKEESFENLVIEIDSVQEVKALIVKYIPKKINVTQKNHIYFEGKIEVKPISYNYSKTNKASKTNEYELFCITEVVSACSHDPYNCFGAICGFTYIDICRLAGGSGCIVSFGPSGNTTSSGGTINYGGGSSSTSPDSIQANYITTIPVYDTLQQQFVISLRKAGSYFSELSPFSQKIIFDYLSFTEYEDPMKTNVKDLLMQIDLNWLKQQATLDQIAVINYFVENDFSLSSRDLVLEIKNQIQLNPNLQIEINSSLKSPFNIDRSAVNDTSIEGIKFNTFYEALTESVEFKKLFINLFQEDKRFNVKFEITERAYEDNDPVKKEVNATTSQLPGTNNIVIKISKQILIAGTPKSQTNIENAKTILHECIHAYLFVKANYPAAGTEFVKILNTMYPTPNEQHDFMYTHMIPTMTKVLSEIRDLATTAPKRAAIEQYTMHPTLNPMTSTPFNWPDFYRNLSLSGLDETSCFKQDFPDPSDALRLHKNYIDAGKYELDR